MADIGPAPRLVLCGTCGKSVDALRAPRVRLFGTSFRFFCSVSHADLFDPARSISAFSSQSTHDPTSAHAPRASEGFVESAVSPWAPLVPERADEAVPEPEWGGSEGSPHTVLPHYAEVTSTTALQDTSRPHEEPPSVTTSTAEAGEVAPPPTSRQRQDSVGSVLDGSATTSPPLSAAPPGAAPRSATPPDTHQPTASPLAISAEMAQSDSALPYTTQPLASPLSSSADTAPASARFATASVAPQSAPAQLGVARSTAAPPRPSSTDGAPPDTASDAATSGAAPPGATLPRAASRQRSAVWRAVRLPRTPVLLTMASLFGALSVTLQLLGNIDWALVLRAIVLVFGALALLLAGVVSKRDPRQLDRLSESLGPLLACSAALVATFSDHALASTAVSTAGLLVAALGLGKLAVGRVTAPLDTRRRVLGDALSARARRVRGGTTQECPADELRPGEEVVVHAGEVVLADGTVVAGNADVVPWVDAPLRVRVGPGAAVVAGARVVSGSLRVIAGWTGPDRAFLRLTLDAVRRADLRSASARAGYLVAQRAAPLAALLTAIAGTAVHAEPLLILLTASATHAALSCPGIAELAAARMARAALDALARGIAFRNAHDLDAAGRVTVAALCARGTVLLGEPEVASIEPLHGYDVEQVLALAGGAESVVSHPVATAVLRAARARGVRPDGARSHNPAPGLGVTAVASSGKALIVGSRALMLREKVSVALAERRINELEALGRTALLVALDGRLVGILALQDGLRPGARAAVQHLLDVNVEPVLLSGDSRETTEAVGRSIDIEHVRPELLAMQRGDEVSKLSEGGGVVAVVGRSPVDDVALAAADVSVALGAPAATNAEWSVGLVTDDVRDAARALRIAHRAKEDAKLLLAACVVPAGTAALAATFGLLPAAVPPLAALAGTLGACLRSREESPEPQT